MHRQRKTFLKQLFTYTTKTAEGRTEGHMEGSGGANLIYVMKCNECNNYFPNQDKIYNKLIL